MHIPPDLNFADLALELDDAGDLHYDWRAIERLCLANGIVPAIALSSEDVACALIAEWYLLHRQAGEARDAAAEAIIARLNSR